MRCFMSNKECEHYPPGKDTSKEVFVVSPFGYPFDEVFENVIKKKGEQELRLNVSRADLALQLGYVMCQRICRKIIESDFIIADISIPNPNVYYEAGLGYSLRRKIIFLANHKMENDYRFGLKKNCNYYLTYRSIDDLKISNLLAGKTPKSAKKSAAKYNCLQDACSNPCRIAEKDASAVRDRFNYFTQKRIVIFENTNAPIVDFHNKVFQEISDANKKRLLASKIRDKSEHTKLKNFLDEFKKWTVDVVELNRNLKLSDLVRTIKNSTICIIDTTQYQEKVNPYVFFCLGLAHGFEREVIPITNRQIKTKHPFDTRGLWHIFYQNKKELKDQFLQILPSIFDEIETAKDNNLVKQLWDPFFKDKNIQIFTCARNVEDKNRNIKKKKNGDKQDLIESGRGKRTNIDKCDYKTVTDFTYFIVQNYQTAEIHFSKPRSKKNYNELKELHKNRELKSLIKIITDKTVKHGDCIIVGSADVNDYTEVNLAAVHNIEPYYTLVKNKTQWRKAVSVLKKKAFIFEKPDADENDSKFASTFYEVGSSNAIYWYGDQPYVCTETPADKKMSGITYGVLTIANNPFTKGVPRKIMMLSGFTGIATYGISQLLTSRDWRKKLMAPLITDYKIHEHDNVNILIQVNYLIEDTDKPGDTRDIKTIKIIKVKNCPNLKNFL